MADSGEQTATGNGEFLLPAAVHILSLEARVDTPTIEIDYRSLLIPKRELHAGWVATASGSVGVAAVDLDLTEIAVTWSGYIDFENIIWTDPSGFPYDDRIMWNIPTGVYVTIFATW